MPRATCGECQFTAIVTQDLSKRVCCGNPPLAFPGPNNAVMTVRPIVNVKDFCCALFKPSGITAIQNNDIGGEQIDLSQRPDVGK